ncbi:MAG: cob(I)yrinic acid a,c-diamide adenosyltransferase [Pirellulaceae bacterium]
MKIYTKTGDEGETGLFAGPRVAKDHPRIAAYGEVDELNSVLGLARTEDLPVEMDQRLARIQNELFDLGAELATPKPAQPGNERVTDEVVAALESAIDDYEAALPPLKQFILPGGTPGAAVLHMARSVCRRAERRVVTLMRTPGEAVAGRIVRYLNRLSDLLFVMARAANSAAGYEDIVWEKSGGSGGQS